MPQEKTTINITNNFYGDTTQQSSNTDSSAGKYPKCGSTKINFKRERIGTAIQSTSRKNVVGSGRKGQLVSQAVYRTVGLCQNCGYTWNPNANSANGGKKGTPTWLWVLGWICIFPLPLTILLLLVDKVVDLVALKTIMGDVNFRVYTNDTSLEQVKALMQGMSPLMNETLSAADLNAALNEVDTNKTANGYYYGELGIALFGSDEKGYE